MKLRQIIGGVLVVVAAFILFMNLVLTGSVISGDAAGGDLSTTVLVFSLLFAGLFLLALGDFKRNDASSEALKVK